MPKYIQICPTYATIIPKSPKYIQSYPLARCAHLKQDPHICFFGAEAHQAKPACRANKSNQPTLTSHVRLSSVGVLLLNQVHQIPAIRWQELQLGPFLHARWGYDLCNWPWRAIPHPNFQY